ncbi:jg12319 [Pararge aegeria aegeria]|uniref:Jg12319 protein n=1 Tax=Pararge aegeria aegeria TaxID=348720 RepID=A0A8S4QHP2_9NEOP|nr:jg12319 [Pararge aegeria aegeria]
MAFVILFLHPYDVIFRWKVVLSEGGEIFQSWQKPEVKLYTRVFLFNITNAEEYLAGEATKVKVKEVGPFVYREALEHSNVTFNENGTLSTIPLHPLIWEEELSEGNKEDDILYLPHIALLSIANVASKESFMTRFGLNNLIGLTNSQPLMKMTAKEFMMGYKSELMTLGNTFMPSWIYFDKLGLIDRMYDFDGDFETVFTGETDISRAGLIDTYRGSTDLPQWDGKHCSNVQNASDGTKFQGAVSRNQTVLFYRKSLCRAAPLYIMIIIFCRFWVQPDAGLPLDVSSKFQINMALGDISNIRHTEKFSHMYLPLLWFDIRMYTLPPSLEFKFKFYLNILPVVEQCWMYISFIAGTILILITSYILTFKVMFKSYPKKNHNISFRPNLWMEREKKDKVDTRGDIYAPCEVPLSDTDSDQTFDTKHSFIKNQSNKIKEMGHRLSDKVHDVKGKFELTHSKHSSKHNDRKNSLINPEESQDETNEAFKSDSSGSEYDTKRYREVKQSDSEDDCKYLEVLDDGSEFDNVNYRRGNCKSESYINIE